MKKALTLILGLMLVTVIGFSSDFTVVKDHLKKEVREIVSFENVTATKAVVIDELNTIRAGIGIDNVTYENTLDKGAQAWAYNLDEENVTHDFTRSTGQFKGEVVLMYTGDLRPERILSEFMNSPKHKQIILNSDYSKVGIGIKRTAGANFVVMRFI